MYLLQFPSNDLVMTIKIIDAAIYWKKGSLILSICLFKYYINRISSLTTSDINYNFDKIK